MLNEMKISRLAGKPAGPNILVDVPRLITAYHDKKPDPSIPAERVSFGTSGHRGSSFDRAFNENHILAISQAICMYRRKLKINGPMFIGMDTHALSKPAFNTSLEVFAANGIEVMISKEDEYTPTPAVSHAILIYNRDRKSGLVDGIVITPSHNPPRYGGFKYNPPNGGPAEPDVTGWIESRSNAFLENGLKGVIRIPFEKALHCSTTHYYDFMETYIRDLQNVIDFDPLHSEKISLGVDPLGGAGVHYWGRIAEYYGLDLTIVNEEVDPTFRFMTLDRDGQIRMDPSSPYAMQRLVGLRNNFDVAFGCDTDHDRHGIVTRSAGLLPPNNFLAAAIFYLFSNRPKWSRSAGVGKTIVSSKMIDIIAQKLGRKLVEVPVGFKWFVDGLLDSSLAFGGEESAGASFVRLDGTVWTTDKDGITAALLAAEMTARTGQDPGEIYRTLTEEFGQPVYDRFEAPATQELKDVIKHLSRVQVKTTELAGEPIQEILTNAPGNGVPIGGLKVIAKKGWFAVRPSGTEALYKIYAESFRGKEHLHRIVKEAQNIIGAALTASKPDRKSVAEQS